MTKLQPASAQLGYVIIYVPDVRDTVAFYTRAFGVKPRFIHESGEYAELETGATALAFAHEGSTITRDVFIPNRADAKAAGAEVAFIVPDVQAALDKAIGQGATLVTKPVDKPWGQTISYVRDLNGFLVELCTEVKG